LKLKFDQDFAPKIPQRSLFISGSIASIMRRQLPQKYPLATSPNHKKIDQFNWELEAS
jgi:hypothetical protein